MDTTAHNGLSDVLIALLKGVLYSDRSSQLWRDLLNLQGGARDQIPADRGVTRAVRTPVSQTQPNRAFAPALREMGKCSDRGAVGAKEQLVMINPPTRPEVSMERQLSPQNRNRPWTKLDDPVLVCFGGVLINSVYTGFGDREGPPHLIVVPNPKRNFLRGPKASEESKLVKIAG